MTATEHRAVADLLDLKWLEVGATPDVAARTAEMGGDLDWWPCNEWTFVKMAEFCTITGAVVRAGPLDNTLL